MSNLALSHRQHTVLFKTSYDNLLTVVEIFCGHESITEYDSNKGLRDIVVNKKYLSYFQGGKDCGDKNTTECFEQASHVIAYLELNLRPYPEIRQSQYDWTNSGIVHPKDASPKIRLFKIRVNPNFSSSGSDSSGVKVSKMELDE